MKSKKLLIAAATLAMIGAASVGPAMAYFTDSHIVSGQVPVNLGDSSLQPHEDLDKSGFVKTVTVQNTGAYDVYVRVKAYTGSTVKVVFEKDQSSGWKLVGEYYEYSEVVKSGATTSKIVFTVTPPANSEFQDDFNVIFSEEATRAEYNKDGSPVTPNWDLKIGDVHTDVKEGENNEEN